MFGSALQFWDGLEDRFIGEQRHPVKRKDFPEPKQLFGYGVGKGNIAQVVHTARTVLERNILKLNIQDDRRDYRFWKVY